MSALLEKFSQASLPEIDPAFDLLRRKAQKVLMQHGFPQRKTEAWKYTPILLLEKRDWADADATSAMPNVELPFDASVLQVHNGRVNPDHIAAIDGVEIRPLQADEIDTSFYVDHDSTDAFAWLNLARLEQGWKIHIYASLAQPLALVFTTDDDFAQAMHPRIVIEVAEGCSAELIEWQDLNGQGLINSVMDISVQANASLGHVIYRDCGDTALIERSHVLVGQAASYEVHALDLGGCLTRQDLKVDLTAADAATRIHGVAALNDRQLVDYHTAIQHQVGPSHSHEDFRILADDRSMGTFNGRIYMLPGADDSHSDMNTANLLLSENARINTKPELEIHAEEVTASHGATIGQLEEAARFYLRSRGLSDVDALALLKLGFAAAAFDALESDSLREVLVAQLKTALSQS
ncbi:MAG: SufD family Fe-S cluster assembly protein [Pseudomonadota bacterium]